MLGLPGSAGVSAGAVADTEVVPYNVVPELDERVACVIVEPVAANMNLVPPGPGFLEGLRAACSASGALLIFDEVITGFRLGPGGGHRLVRRDARPLVLRQGDRRRAAGRRVRRAPRAAGRAGAGRSRVPGRHAVGKPARHGGGARRAGRGDGRRTTRHWRRASRLFAKDLESAVAAGGLAVAVPVVGPLVGLFVAPAERRRSRRPSTTRARGRSAGGDTYARFFHAMLRRGVALAPGRLRGDVPRHGPRRGRPGPRRRGGGGGGGRSQRTVGAAPGQSIRRSG